MNEVLYEIVDDVAWITINRPEARNALNTPTRQGLFAAFERFGGDDGAKVAVLTGAGDQAFCAGGDLKEMAEMKLEVPPPDFIPHLGVNIFVDKPVVAAVNGAALAGGFLLAQMCDLCIAVDDAQFAITEARWGRGAPWAAPLPWLIPPRVALELLLTAEPITARTRVRRGPRQSHRSPRRTAPRRADDGATHCRQRAALGTGRQGHGVRGGRARAQGGAARGRPVLQAAYKSEDAQEGPRAFREKRRPVWKGR